MPFTTKTREELIRAFTDAIRSKITGADTSWGSDYHIMATVLADVFRGNQSQAMWLAKQIFPGTAEASYVLLHAALRGLTQQQAAAATGKVLLIAGSATTGVQAEGSTLTHADGTVYETTDSVAGSGAGWISGGAKTVGKGSTKSRILIKDADGLDNMRVGDILEINGEKAAIKELISVITAIDIYPSLSETPVEDDDIDGKYGVMVEVVAQTTGASTNKDSRNALTLNSPASNFEATAYVVELTGGGDIETPVELGARCQSHDSQGIDNTPEALRTLARETEGVRLADAAVFSNFRGLGAHDIVLIGTEGARLVGDIPTALVQENIDANTMDDIVVKPMEYQETDAIEVEVEGIVGYGKDWFGTKLELGVFAANDYQIMTDPGDEINGILEVGDRVVAAKDLGGGDWAIYLITVTAIQDFNTFHYTPAITPWLDNDDKLYAAGPLTEPIDQAIRDYLDTLGPGARTATSDYADRYECQPVPGTEWDEWLRLSAILAACQGVEGVEKVTLISPTTDKLPSVQKTLSPKYILVKYGV